MCMIGSIHIYKDIQNDINYTNIGQESQMHVKHGWQMKIKIHKVKNTRIWLRRWGGELRREGNCLINMYFRIFLKKIFAVECFFFLFFSFFQTFLLYRINLTTMMIWNFFFQLFSKNKCGSTDRIQQSIVIWKKSCRANCTTPPKYLDYIIAMWYIYFYLNYNIIFIRL